jgi:hypothetical protein
MVSRRGCLVTQGGGGVGKAGLLPLDLSVCNDFRPGLSSAFSGSGVAKLGYSHGDREESKGVRGYD